MSPHLIEQANRALGAASPHVSFAVGDILTLPASRYDAILCRGVLNDLINEDATERGKLTFTSDTKLDLPTRRLLLKEQHTLEVNGREHPSDYEFIMRCFGAYDPAVAPGETDRLVAVAQKFEAAA